ncbi:glycosyltransferase [Desulfurococcus sp.]|uniref:glycosyltransferase n=1 Tax=Desulfurococcus sp. TaxID=51678 RepID=UPI0038574158
MYGTVFNNVQYFEESIKSVFNPNYDIIIVDSCSTNGTWGKLLELRKEYNLTL